jgi:hypothetical protein
MPTVPEPISVEIKRHLPTEMLEGIELWGARNPLS